MASGDFYYYTLIGSLGGQQTINQFWFLQTSGSGGAIELASAFLTDWTPLIQACVSSAWTSSSARCYNWNDPVDFIDDTYAPVAGTRPAIYQSTQAAIALSQVRKRADMRQGRKRLAGVAGADVNNGVITVAPMLTALTALVDALSAPLTVSDPASSWQQIIVRRVNVGTPTSPDYRVPTTITSSDYYIADTWAYDTRVTTQNTRKFGRGA